MTGSDATSLFFWLHWKQSKRKYLVDFYMLLTLFGAVLSVHSEENSVDLSINPVAVDAKLSIAFVEEQRLLNVKVMFDPPQPNCALRVEAYPVCHFSRKGDMLFSKLYRSVPIFSEQLLTLSLPRDLLLPTFTSDYYNSSAIFTEKVEVLVTCTCDKFQGVLKAAVKMRDFSERFLLIDGCMSFYGHIMRLMMERDLHKCKDPYASIVLLPRVVPLTGQEDSVVKKVTHMAEYYGVPYFSDASPVAKFTIAFWMYMDSPCLSSSCSVLIRRDEAIYLSPVILVNNGGVLFVQFLMENNASMAFLTSHIVPLHQWLQLTFLMEGNKADLFVSSYVPVATTNHYTFSCPTAIRYHPLAGFWMFGGFWSTPGIQGYVGYARLYPFDARTPYKMQYTWSDSEHIRKLDIESHLQSCRNFRNAISENAIAMLLQMTYQTCSAMDALLGVNESRAGTWKSRSGHALEHVWLDENALLLRRLIHYEIQKSSSKQEFRSGNFTRFAVLLQSKAVQLATDLGSNITDAASLLRASGCLGNAKSYYILASMFSHGYRGLVNEGTNLAVKYHLFAARLGNSMSRMAMATKHLIGLDGVVKDCSLAAAYFRAAAVTTKKLVEEEDSGVQTHMEMINLKDAEKFSTQRGTDSDAYSWLTHQATMGSADAQLKLGHMLFHGQNGVVANRVRGIEYFNMAANQSVAEAIHTLGVIHLRGLSVEENKTKAIEMLTKSAALNFSQADNSLGYVEWIINQNRTAAALHFKRAADRNDTDGIFHFGSMHDPAYGEPLTLDMELAFDGYKRAAAKGHKSACMKVGEAMMTGARMPYDCGEAIKYLKFVAEHHPDIGKFLRNGIDGYLKGEFLISFFNYLMAAESGLALANSNVAFACEEMLGLGEHVAGQCVLRYHNMSALLDWADSITKMGDFYWYGKGVTLNTTTASHLYCRACGKSATPLALFNVAYLIEYGFPVSGLSFAGIEESQLIVGNKSLAQSLYWSCLEAKENESEGFLPCLLAWMKISADMFIANNPWSASMPLSLMALLLLLALVFIQADRAAM